MSVQDNFRLMGEYNQWMNAGLYQVCSTIPTAELAENRGAFFGSMLGTLNHILVGDTIWLKRFAEHPSQFSALSHLNSVPSPTALNEILHSDIFELRSARETMDTAIIEFVNQATDSDYDVVLAYKNTKGSPFKKKFGFLVQHFFNHQTHHRGQLTTLLSQSGLDFGTTDLLAKIHDVA